VQKGYNSDLHINGRAFHVQTEDWGLGKSAIVTKVFQNGAVLKSFVTPYSEFSETGPVSVSESVRLAMRQQHRKILDLVHSGQL